MKHIRAILLFTIFVSLNTLAEQLHYDFLSPGYKDSVYLECDTYVRLHHAAFRTDIAQLLIANKNKDWIKATSILSKYDTSNLYIDNPFTKSVYNCGNGYSFSDGNNYYRNMYPDIYVLVTDIKRKTKNKKVCKPNIEERSTKINHALDIILSATNKAANKSLNSDATQKTRSAR